MAQDDWSMGVVSLITESVRHYRSKRGLSAQQLADACKNDVKYPIPRSVIANLENGRRETISVTEWLVLARALKVPPLLLLFPLGRTSGKVEVLPGVGLTPWDAVQFAETGEHFLSDTEGDPTIALFRDYENTISRWRILSSYLREARRILAGELATIGHPFPDDRDEVQDFAAKLEQDLAPLPAKVGKLRLEIEQLGLEPPALPLGLRDLGKGAAL